MLWRRRLSRRRRWRVAVTGRRRRKRKYIFFEGTGDEVVTAIDYPILDAAKNQSFPMSFANNLQFLKNTKGLQFAFEHKPGLKPSVSPGDDSLVGRIEESIGRSVTDRRNGEGAFGLQGKLRFMAEYSLSSQLAVTHFGSFGPDSGASNVSASVNGVTATSTAGGTSINFDSIFASLRRQACTVVLQWPTGAHASSILAAGRAMGSRGSSTARTRTRAQMNSARARQASIRVSGRHER
jgi:hypothetical protein